MTKRQKIDIIQTKCDVYFLLQIFSVYCTDTIKNSFKLLNNYIPGKLNLLPNNAVRASV